MVGVDTQTSQVSEMLFFSLRLLMEELVNFMERVPKAQSATCWKNKEIQRWMLSLFCPFCRSIIDTGL